MRKLPSQSRSKKTVGYIVQATKELLEEHGLGSLNTNSIAKRAGVSIGSLYQYFPSKDVVIDYLVDEYVEINFRELKNFLDNDEEQTLEEMISQMVDSFAELFVKNKNLRSIFFQQLSNRALPKIVKFENVIQLALVDKLELHQEALKVSDLELAAYMMVNIMTGPFRRTLNTSTPMDIDKITRELKWLISSYLTKCEHPKEIH